MGKFCRGNPDVHHQVILEVAARGGVQKKGKKSCLAENGATPPDCRRTRYYHGFIAPCRWPVGQTDHVVEEGAFVLANPCKTRSSE